MLARPNPYARLKLTHPKVKELAERYAKWKGIMVDVALLKRIHDLETEIKQIERIHDKGSCVWASEIEEFPIAVTKHHFPDEEAEAGGNGG